MKRSGVLGRRTFTVPIIELMMESKIRMNSTTRSVLAMTFAGLLVACGTAESPESPSTASLPPLSDDVEESASASTQRASLRIEPLASCEAGQVSTLQWGAQLLAQGPVEIRIGEEIDGDLFARAGAPGNKQTGPWLAIGTVFIARTADGTEVGRAVATGPNCAQSQ